MRIAMISTPFVSVPPADYGGTELVVYELVEGLIEQGHDVTLFATGDSETRATLAFLYRRAQWPPDSLADVNHVSWALAEVAKGDFDLIHAHSASALAMARLVPGIPMVYTVHHNRVEEFSQFYRYFPEAYYVAISENQRRLELSLPRCEVIYHGLDPKRFQWTNTASNYLCFIGRFTEVKGPHIAIDVAREVGLPIRVAGRKHPAEGEYADREVQPRLTLPHVTYLGCVGMKQKVPLLRNARALLAPLQWDEPFGLVMIEAMLSGCPVVAFARGSARELVEPGITGFFAESPEQMAELVRPGSALDTFDRRACREHAQARFGRERMVSSYARLYERAVAAARGQKKKLEQTYAL